MIYLKTILNVIDNSGVLTAECIKVLNKKRPKNCALIGDKIVVVVKKARPAPQNVTGQLAAQRLRQGDMRHAVVVRTKQNFQRPDGSVIKFGDNACVLIQDSGEPIGTRVSGVIAEEVKKRGFTKIVSMAPRTV